MKKKKMLSVLMCGCMLMGSIVPLAGASAAETYAYDGYVDDSAATGAAADIPVWGVTPNHAQLKYHKDGFAVFCHFGPNTFNNIEWGENYGDKSPNEIFKLTEDFDAETLVKTAKEAGADRLMITAKHHDGFCIWDSETTDYDIAETDYYKTHKEFGDGQGDILKEISDACTKYNLDMGLYLSPWDIHEQNYGCYGDGNNNPSSNGAYDDYNELYQAQIREICTAKKEDGTYKYGNNNPNRSGDRFVEWWMDGATGSGAYFQTYDWAGIFSAIRDTNPDCQIFGTHKAGAELSGTGGIHWIGNEAGIAAVETWAKVNKGENFENYPRGEGNAIIGKAEGNRWSVPEADAKLLNAGWFWSQSKQSSLLSMEKLGNMYFNTIGRGAVLLLNMSPNSSGTIDENQKNRLLEFGAAVKEIYENDLTEAEGVKVYADSIYKNSETYKPSNLIDEYTLNTSVTKEERVYDETGWAPEDGAKEGSVIIDLGSEQTFDTIKIEEYIQKGQRISEFTIEYMNERGQWKEFYSGKTIGSQSVTRHAPVTSSQIRITVKSDYATPILNDVGVYKGPETFELEADDNIEFIVDESELDYKSITNATRTGSWQTADNTHYWSAGTNSSVTFKFTGTAFYVKAIEDPNHSSFEVVVDGKSMGTVNLNNSTRIENKIVYYSDDIGYGEHTVELKTLNSSGKTCIDVYGIYGLNIEEGIFEVGNLTYDIAETDTVQLEVVRKHGSKGAATVNFSTTTGSAQQNMNYEYKDGTLEFADGETSKVIDVKIYAHKDTTSMLNFYLDINTAEGARLGLNTRAVINIHPADKTATLESLNALIAKAKALLDNPAITEEAKAYLNEKIAFAEKAAAQPDAAQSVYGGAATALRMAIDNTGIDSSVLNLKTTGTVIYEAENAKIEQAVAGDQNIHIVEGDNYSGGKKVGWVKAGDKIIIPFYAEATGTYTMDMYAQSGRVEGSHTSNKFDISGTNVEETSVEFYGPVDAPIKKYTCEIVVTKSGAGELVLTAAADHDGPDVDKFEFTCKEISQEGLLVLPTDGSEVSFEAEDAQLVPTVEDNEHLHTKESSKASGRLMLDWYMAGDKVIIPFYAEKAGTYNADIYAECGRVEGTNRPNRLLLTGKKVEEDELDFYGSSATAPQIEKRSYQIVVTKSGYGEMVFTAAEGYDGPNLDKLVFSLDVPVTVDKTVLNAKIKEAEAIENVYTANSFKALTDAIAAGKVIFDKDDAQQAEVDNAVTAITEAIEALAYNSGDTDHDGALSISDVTAIQSHVVNKAVENFDEKLADANKDGKINIIDATTVQLVVSRKYTLDGDGNIVH